MKYKVGDTVAVKTWDKLVLEYGCDNNGGIPCDGYFGKNMKEYCGKTFTIFKIVGEYYKLKGVPMWSFTDSMLEDFNEERSCWNCAHVNNDGSDSPCMDCDLCNSMWEAEQKTDVVNHPAHYCREGGMESIDEMVAVFGKEAVMNFCICNVWKYRYRATDKNGLEDLKKSDWYMKKYNELKKG